MSAVAKGVSVPATKDTVTQLVEGQEVVVKIARCIVPAAEKASYGHSADVLALHVEVHEKNAWMLGSSLS